MNHFLERFSRAKPDEYRQFRRCGRTRRPAAKDLRA